MRRVGELLEAYQSKGGRPGKTSTQRGTGSQREAAKAAGLSKKDEVAARRVAAIPAAAAPRVSRHALLQQQPVQPIA